MSPRRPPALKRTGLLPPPEPALPDAPRGLLRKYQELLSKHETLVRKLEVSTLQRISTHRLAAWALETNASALALVRDGVVLLANRRWHQLGHGGPWRRVHPGHQQPVYKTLRQAAEATSEVLRTLGDEQPLAHRYLEQGEGRTLEIRVERVATPPSSHPQRAVLVLVQDITVQVRAERLLEEARSALAQQEHLRALGELASGLAHDLNNTLNSMKLRLEMIDRDAEFAARQRGHLDALLRIVTDASTRVHRLQDFSRQRPEALGEQLQLASVIHEAAEIARSELEDRSARAQVPLRLQVEVPVLPMVSGSAADLRYVFINLLLNAWDAMPQGGTIRVSGSTSGATVLITVEDEGTGIPEEHLHTIFQPFFTTKGEQGTGLGLSMAYGVMARLGGSISAANRPQGGAVFTLTFPSEAPPAQQSKPSSPRSRKR